ncbi:MAG: hypothetical protein AAF416_14410 [Pseudomonadota bacterium]
MRRSILPHMLEARSEGIPSLGAGAIYPIPWQDVCEDNFEIPAHWPRAYGIDVGWNRTAALWGAWEPGLEILHIYAEYYREHATPETHAAAVKARGAWIRGVIDPASNIAGQSDGKRILQQLIGQGLNLTKADNAVEAGIYQVWSLLSTGRLRFFRTCRSTEAEYRNYHRKPEGENDRGGKIHKKDDHAMDALRYLVMSGRPVAQVEPALVSEPLQGRLIGSDRAGY